MKRSRLLLVAAMGGALVAMAGCSSSEGQAQTEGAGARRAQQESDATATSVRSESGQMGRRQAAAADPVLRTESAPQDTADEFEGTLVYDDPEWYLDVEGEVTALHMGNRAYIDSLGMELDEGDRVVVTGVAEEDGVYVQKVAVDGAEYVLRDEFGAPMWAGLGNRAQAVSSEAAPQDRFERQAQGDSRDEDQLNGEKGGTGRGYGRGRANAAQEPGTTGRRS